MRMNLTVKLTFANGEESVLTVQTTPQFGDQQQQPEIPPYRLADGTAPEEPTLVASPDFVNIA